MINLPFPEPSFRIRQQDGRPYIFDQIRKGWFRLTEEEWVRQNFIQYLIKEKNYPKSVIALEKELLLNDTKKRFDIVVYNKDHKPFMLVECKAPHVKLDETVLQQALRYHMSIPVNFLVLTNGTVTLGWEKSEGQLIEQQALPDYH